LTPGQPPGDDCYIPPVTPVTPAPKRGGADNSTWVIIAILLFAVLFVMTIVVPAILAAFIFGMAGNIEHTKVVAATVQQNNANTILVTYQGGQDAGQLVGMTVTVTDSNGQVQTKSLGSATGTIPLGVGDKVSFDGAFTGKDHAVATGHFTDGSEQVILDTFI
jgi:archaeal type IV pilus assembly protein PilA